MGIICSDCAIFIHLFNMFKQLLMKFFSKNDYGEIFDLMRLLKRKRLEILVHGAVTAGHHYERERVFNQQYFADKKMPHVYPFIKVWVWFLLCLELDIAAD